MFIDKLLIGSKPVSEREITSVRYAMKGERNQDTRFMEPRIKYNALAQRRMTFVARFWNPAPSRTNSNESDLTVIYLGSSIHNNSK